MNFSSGAADAGKIVALDSSGQLSPSMGGGGGGSSVAINGFAVSSPNFIDSASVTFHLTGSNVTATVVSGSTSFSAITTGTNNTAQTFTVGNTSTLTFTGTGIVNAREVGGIDVAGNTPAHAGQLLISQPGNTTALWADPMVQGLFPPATNTATGNSGGPINPVMIGVQTTPEPRCRQR